MWADGCRVSTFGSRPRALAQRPEVYQHVTQTGELTRLSALYNDIGLFFKFKETVYTKILPSWWFQTCMIFLQ